MQSCKLQSARFGQTYTPTAQHRRRALHLPVLRSAPNSSPQAPTVTEAVAHSAAPPHASNQIYELAEAWGSKTSTSAPSTSAVSSVVSPTALAAVGALALAAYGIKKVYDTPSRTYNQNVGEEYDAWTSEGILEYYWGEHIHLGYYNEEERKRGYLKKNFKQAKYDFSEEMFKWSGATSPQNVLDVGCGFGGTSRYLAKKFPDAKVEGITLSKEQVRRGTELASERGLNNVTFKVMDALAMEYPDNSFDLVWACESGEHMPDKKKYIDEMTRVLKPGGTLVIACWCQRDETPEAPFSEKDKRDLDFLYAEWAHPYFISINEFARLMEGTGQLDQVSTADWTEETLPSWHHSIWVGVFDPWIVISKPQVWYKCSRDGVTLLRMHNAFRRGLMQYGMMKAVKKAA